MTTQANGQQKYTLEAIKQDTESVMALLHSFTVHPSAALLSFSLLPPLSMYAVESYRAMKTLNHLPPAQLEKLLEILKPFRHRAKQLDSPEKTVEQVAIDLSEFAESQRRFFLDSHTGFLSSLKRALQPDLGLYTYDGHIITTTHSIAFNFGQDSDVPKKGFDIGKALGAYTKAMGDFLGIKSTKPVTGSTNLPAPVEMRDIKSQALYKRGPLGRLPAEIAVGLIYLLGNLNNMSLVIQKLLPAGGHTQFRLKFITAYHANSNLKAIQGRFIRESALAYGYGGIFNEILGNSDSRWLRKRTSLRNLLVHYMIDEPLTTGLLPRANWTQAIEHFGSRLTYEAMDSLLDRHVKRMSSAIEMGFELDGDPFWYGRVV